MDSERVPQNRRGRLGERALASAVLSLDVVKGVRESQSQRAGVHWLSTRRWRMALPRLPAVSRTPIARRQ